MLGTFLINRRFSSVMVLAPVPGRALIDQKITPVLVSFDSLSGITQTPTKGVSGGALKCIYYKLKRALGSQIPAPQIRAAASRLSIHPSILAGRLRRIHGYQKHSTLVAQGMLRELLGFEKSTWPKQKSASGNYLRVVKELGIRLSNLLTLVYYEIFIPQPRNTHHSCSCQRRRSAFDHSCRQICKMVDAASRGKIERKGSTR